MRRLAVAVVLVVLVCVARPCAAQDFRAQAILGIYAPTSSLASFTGTCPGGGQCGTYDVTQIPGPMLGFRVARTSRFGYYASLAYAFTWVSSPAVPNGVDFSVPVKSAEHTLITNAGVLYDFKAPQPASGSLYVLGGGSFVVRAASGGMTGASDAGFHVGLGYRFNRGKAVRRVQLEDIVHGFNATAPVQNSLVLSLSL